MRIEELSNNNFVKLPTPLEKEIISIINRFFNSDPNFIKGSVEEILTEFTKRIKPTINVVCREALIEEKDKLLDKDFNKALEKAKDNLIEQIIEFVTQIKKEIINPKTIVIDITDTTNEVLVNDIENFNNANIKVYLNGILQTENEHYTFITNKKNKIEKIVFESELILYDKVVIEYWDIDLNKGGQK